ncbi:MAG: radical SAM protein [Desulforhopalus sp.]|nr:radical SAM protein [Desulforhopalus sp.]
MNNRPGAPLLVTVNVTGVCNLNCSYCYFQPRLQTHMPFDDYRTTLNILREHEIFLLTLSGGEPFLHPKISELLHLAHDTFEHTSILTNGTALQDEHFETIDMIVRKKGFFPIQVSVDSTEPEINDNTRGKTAVVLKNLQRLKEVGASITAAIVVSSQNIDRIEETIASLADVTRHFHVMPIKPVPFLKGKDWYLQVDPPRMDQVWKKLIGLRDKYGVRVRTPVDDLCNSVETSAVGAPCMAGFTKLAIDPNLDVRPCDKCVSTVVGSLKEETLDEIWNGDRLAGIYQRATSFCVSGLN